MSIIPEETYTEFVKNFNDLPDRHAHDMFSENDIQALSGVYAKDVHVRMACLNAVKCIPALAGHYIPENIEVATSIWLALLHDPEKLPISFWFMRIP
nr:eIF-2-alpha kinase activator GCN1 isoform X17 [Ipomoea batatas]GME20295.1 eIF-2-alpha kinase activator GCN1 isoform X17 [Ipomoea batatas]